VKDDGSQERKKNVVLKDQPKKVKEEKKVIKNEEAKPEKSHRQNIMSFGVQPDSKRGKTEEETAYSLLSYRDTDKSDENR